MNKEFQQIDQAVRRFTNNNFGLFQPGASIDLFGNLNGEDGEVFHDNWMPEDFRISKLADALREHGEAEAAAKLETWSGINL